MLPDKIGHYRLVEKLGEGGMGVVYCGQDETCNRRVAVKVLNSKWAQDPGALERFHREARITAALSHPHICSVYEVGEFAGCPFMVMELLKGQTLSAALDGWPLPVDRILDISIQVAEALQVAHGNGVIHRDIKSSNIFITEQGVAKLIDFGLAKICPRESPGTDVAGDSMVVVPEHSRLLSMPGLAIGTVTNMSPEQVEGKELDCRSDLFSFGIVLYEMATGVLPFQGVDFGMIMHAILSWPHRLASKLNPNIPAELDYILGKVLEKDRALRYQTPAELKSDLEKLQARSRLEVQ